MVPVSVAPSKLSVFLCIVFTVDAQVPQRVIAILHALSGRFQNGVNGLNSF